MATPSPPKSFADVLSAPKSSVSLVSAVSSDLVDNAIAGTHKGFPSLAFEDAHITSLSQPFTWSIVGKFSQ